MKTLVRAAFVCTLIATLPACGKQTTSVLNDFTGPSATGTGSGGTGSGFGITLVSERFVAPCQKSLDLATPQIATWGITPGSSASVTRSVTTPTQATAVMTASGTYTITATAPDGRVGSLSFTLDCGGGTVAGGPGPFRQEGGVICSPLDTSRAERTIGFSWTSAGAGASYRVEEKIIGGGSDQQWREVQNNSSLSVTLTRRRWSHQHFYRVTATLNGVSRLWDNGEWMVPCEQLADPAPPPPAPPTTGPGPGGPGPGGPGPSVPGTGNAIRITGPSSVGGSVGSTATGTAECSTNGGSTWGGCAAPWWFSSDPSAVQVHPTSGALRRNAPRSATVCVQWSVSQMTPVDCRVY